jgi:hypothetical protein
MSQDFARIASILNVTFQEPLADLLNRSNPVLRALQKKAVASHRIYLKGIVDSDHEAGPILDNADVTMTSPGTDYITPILDWSTYAAKFRVGKRAMAQAAGNPGEIGNLLMSEIQQATKDLATKIAADVFAGSVANGLVGLQTMINDTGTWAGIDRAQAANANLRSVVINHVNAGAGLELSTGILNELDARYFNANGYGWSETPGRFTGVTDSRILNKYKALAESIDLSSLSTAHFVNQANQSGQLGIGNTGFMGVPFLRDRNVVAASGDVANSGRLYFLDMSQIHLCVLNPGEGATVHQVRGYESAPDVDGIRPVIEILGNKGEYVEGYVKTYIQLATPDPKKAGALLKGIKAN